MMHFGNGVQDKLTETDCTRNSAVQFSCLVHLLDTTKLNWHFSSFRSLCTDLKQQQCLETQIKTKANTPKTKTENKHRYHDQRSHQTSRI